MQTLEFYLALGCVTVMVVGVVVALFIDRYRQNKRFK